MADKLFVPGDVVAASGLQSRCDLNQQTGRVLSWDVPSSRYTVCFDHSSENLKVRPANLLRRPSAVRPDRPAAWTSASLEACFCFLWCAENAGQQQQQGIFGQVRGPLITICEFLRVPCRGLAALGHGGSRGGHPLAALVRLWHVLGVDSEICARAATTSATTTSTTTGCIIALALSDLFRDLDTFNERQVVSLDPMLEHLRRAGTIQNVGVGESADFDLLGIELCEQLNVPPEKRFFESYVNVRRSQTCCGVVHHDKMALVLGVVNKPLETQLSEKSALHPFEILGNYTCNACGAEKTSIFQQWLFPDMSHLSIQFSRFQISTPERVNKSPVGIFPEILSLPAELFENGVAARFSLVALVLYNQDTKRAAVGYSMVIRAAGAWWWHRWTAVGHPVTGELVDSMGGQSCRVVPTELNWASLQSLRGIVYRLCYERL
ncbi:unnamed protein product [Polarella glacialis]|uniref:Ubiquitinyl hydrolase 1 n=1 Tax=Polarella glacialis TaxID=89957 RepID=A0A813GR78_POLGL|nr:unnamed protein product [Polarella glacialis]